MQTKPDLKNLTRQDYDDCLSAIIASLSKLDFIVSIYQFGTVSFPGVSDIDLLVVVKEKNTIKEQTEKIKKIIAETANGAYLFFHHPIVVTTNDMPYLELFHSVENLNLLYGEDTKNPNRNVFGKDQLLTWNSYFYPKFWDLAQTKKIVSTRFALLLLNNLAHCIKNNDAILGSTEYAEYKKETDELRMRAMENIEIDLTKQIDQTLKKGLAILQQQEDSAPKNKRCFTPAIDWETRRVFWPSQKIRLWKLGLFSMFCLPKRYFETREKVNDVLKSVERSANIDRKTLLTIRRRFQSVKTLNL